MSKKIEEDLSLPKSTIQKIIKEHLKADIRCSNETRELISECCVEFVQMLATEANDICNKQNKKTISGAHIIDSLRKLGYESYIEKAEEVLEEHKVEQEKTNKPKKFNTSGLSQEELLKEQQRLFNQARSNHQMTHSGLSSPSTVLSSPLSANQPQMNVFDQNSNSGAGSPFVFSSYQPPRVQLSEKTPKKEEEKKEE
eukprot:gene7727-12197_t